MKNRGITAAAISAMLAASFLAGCGSQNTASSGSAPSSASTAGSNSAQTTGKDGLKLADSQEITELVDSDTTDWNYLVETSNTPAMYIDSLVEYDNYGICQPCLAESWERSDDGLTWTFHIRKGVPWMTFECKEYGEDVTANDFVTSCKYILDPDNGSRLADMMFTIAGAEDYYNAKAAGKDADFSSVGVKALDDYTLQYTLAKPCPYFLSSTTYKNFFPANQKFIDEMGDKFSTDNQTMLYCGEYIMTDYVPQSHQDSVLNPEYWDAGNMHITAEHLIYNAEAETVAPEMFLRGEVNYAEIPTEQLDEWLNNPDKASQIRPCRPSFYSYAYIFSFWANFDEKYEPENWKIAVNNVNFRKAIMHAIDKEALIEVDDPYNAKNHIENTFTPADFVSADGKDYQQLDALKDITNSTTFSTDEAQQYKEKAMSELKDAGCHFPVIVYIPYDTGSSADTQRVQVLSQMLERNLGTDFVKCETEGYADEDFSNQTFRSGNFGLARITWMADYLDPLSYTDPFRIIQNDGNCIYMADGMSDVSNTMTDGATKGKDGRYYSNIKYDDMVAEADKETTDMSKRYNSFAECEKWLVDDQCLIIPYMRGGTGYVASSLMPFESQYAAFGASDGRYKYQYLYEKGIDSDEYKTAYAEWQKEREEKIKKLADEGKVFGVDY